MAEPSDMFDPLPPRTADDTAASDRPGSTDRLWRPIVPVPGDVALVFPPTPLGEPTAVWDYSNAEGGLFHRICRWDLGKGEKTIRPLSYCESADGKREWRWMHLPGPRPVYGLDHLAQHPAASIVLTEGEKAADAARALFPDRVGITSSGGSGAAGEADWSPLAGRDVTIWPDNDAAGKQYACAVAKLIKVAGAASIRIVSVPAEWPEGWDVADLPPGGIDAESLRRMLQDAHEHTVLEAGTAVAPIDLDDAGLKQRDALLRICDNASVWQSPDREAFASIPVGDHMEHYAVASRAFGLWMRNELANRYTQRGRPASATDNIVREVRTAVEARALYEGKSHCVALRVLEHDDAIYIDRGTADWSAIEISKRGRAVVPRTPAPILRGKRTAPFPGLPSRGSLRPLRRLLRHLDRDAFILLVVWCLGALLPRGPYTILVLVGEQGSGKSMLARLVQRITDPVHGDLLQPPGNGRDLIAAAKTNRVLSFDNLSGLSPELADSLCRLATGSEIGGRALFTDHDSASFSACRPMVINGIPDLASRGDLADRAVVIRLPAVTARTTERDWWAAVEQALPSTLSALFDALSCGLQNLDTTPTPSDIRMADFARFIAAAEPRLPWRPGSFLKAYRQSRRETTTGLADGDPVASAVRAFMAGATEWIGLMSQLYGELTLAAARDGKLASGWPGNARWFGESLRRSAPALRELGIDFRERRGNAGRIVTLGRIATPATPASPQRVDRADERVASVPSVAKIPVSSSERRGDRHRDPGIDRKITDAGPSESRPTVASARDAGSARDDDGEIIEGRT